MSGWSGSVEVRHSQWVFFIGCSEFVVCSSAPLVLWDLGVSNLHVLTTMVSFIVMWKIPDLPCWYLLHPLGGLADTLGRIPPNPSPSCSHPIEVSWPSGNFPDYPSIQLSFSSEPTYNRSSHRQWKRFTTLPQ